MIYTIEQELEHLKQGVQDDICLVCNETLLGSWTDYNGQIRCATCGTTYQILGSHLKEEFLAEHGLKSEDIARRYCDVYREVPMLRDYWQVTHRQIPYGTYLGDGPIRQEDYESFYRWLWENREAYQSDYADAFKWDVLKRKYGGE